MRNIKLIILLSLFSAAAVFADGLLAKPESVAYDTINHRYLVSSLGNASIIAIDTLGVQTLFIGGLGKCYSNHIYGNVMYYTSGGYVKGLDINTAVEVFSVAIPGAGGDLDGITADSSGNLYIVDPQGGRMHILDIASQVSSVFVNSGLPAFPQDVTFDATHNRLYLCSFASQAPIIAFNLPDPIPVIMTVTPFGNHDGIITDREGNVFISAASKGAVYRYDSAFSKPPELIIDNLFWPTGMDYNVEMQVLAIPTFYDSSITFLDLSQPEFRFINYSTYESAGDGDGFADAGESMQINATVHNYRQRALNVDCEVTTTDPYITVTAPTVTLTDILAWDGEASTQSPLEISISASCPDPHIAQLELHANAESGYTKSNTILLFVGSKIDFSDDCESGEGYWQHQTTWQHVDDWHLEDYRAYSGTTSWKAGGAGDDDYGDCANGMLVSQPFMLSTNTVLSFYHWIEAEAIADSAKDGGAVFLRTPDGAHHQIEPVGGYPDALMYATDMGLPSGTLCFSRSHDWELAEFDLSAYTGVVQLVFQFCSNSSTTREGWYIDDISVIGDPLYVCGDANGDESVNVGDAVYLGNFVFRNSSCATIPPIGCPPDPEEAGDVNCDGGVNIGDAVYLVNFVFRQGSPVPCAACP